MQRLQGADGPVGEAVDHLQPQPAAVQQAEDAPAALGAEVEGQQVAGSGYAECIDGTSGSDVALW